MNYTATGSISLYSLAKVCFVEHIPVLFSKRDLVFVMAKAKKGILEKICLKTINLNVSVFNYIDTFNEVYLETELCSEEHAVNYAIAYYQKLINELKYQTVQHTTLERLQKLQEAEKCMHKLQQQTSFIAVNPTTVDVSTCLNL